MASIQTITAEIKYHSFIICQTEDKEVAEKWDYHVLSSNGQLLMSSEEHKSKHEFNISVDTIACTINGHSLILATGDWLKKCLMDSEAQLLKKFTVLRYDTLWIAKSTTFLYYIGVGGAFGDKFVELTPKYIHDSDCLVFQYSSPAVHYKALNNFELTENFLREQKLNNDAIYSFQSEYALLSDMHFLNCLVRSRKEIGSYIKQKDGTYKFWMNPRIVKALSSLFPLPKL